MSAATSVNLRLEILGTFRSLLTIGTFQKYNRTPSLSTNQGSLRPSRPFDRIVTQVGLQMASAHFQESPRSDIIFRGTNGNECEDFVAAIREHAFANGTDKDRDWMLRYATTRLRGKALRWHATLDPSVQDDWYLFVKALFEEYPLVEERDERGEATPVWTSTTFSPTSSISTLPGTTVLRNTNPEAPGDEAGPLDGVRALGSLRLNGVPIPFQKVYNPFLPGFQIGRLRVVYEAGGPGPHYVSHWQKVTHNIRDALIVSFIPSSESHQILCVPAARNLGVDLFLAGTSEFHPLVDAAEPAVPCSRRVDSKGAVSQTVTNIWSISPDGTLLATLGDIISDPKDWRNQNLSESFTTTTVYVEISGATISFAKDYITPQALHPTSGRPFVRAHLAFEPI